MVPVHFQTGLGGQLLPEQLLDEGESLLGVFRVPVDGGVGGHRRDDAPLLVGNGEHG